MVEVQIRDEVQHLSTLRDIEQHLGVEGLVGALLDLTRKEKLFKGLSEEVLNHSVASPYMILKIRRSVFQSATELEDHNIRCTAGENFRNRETCADFMVYRLPKDSAGRQLDKPIMGDRSVGRLICFFCILFPLLAPAAKESLNPAERPLTYGRFAAIRPMVQIPITNSQLARGMPQFEWAPGKAIMVI